LQPERYRRKVQDPASNEFDYYLAIKVRGEYSQFTNFRPHNRDASVSKLTFFFLYRIPVVRIGRLAGQFAKPR